MEGKKILFIVVGILAIPHTSSSALQDLDEVMNRKGRYGVATRYTGEVSPNYYTQPETLAWTDTTTNHEVWRLSFAPGGQDIYSKEYASRAWSGDGSKIGFFDYGVVRASSDPAADAPSGGRERWIMSSDGSKLKASTAKGGYDIPDDGFTWLNTERAAYLFGALNTYDFTDAAIDVLYKVTIDSSNLLARSVLFDWNDSSRKYIGWAKDCVSADDSILWTKDVALADWPTPNDINSQKFHFLDLGGLSVIESYGSARAYGPTADPYFNHAQVNEGDLKGGSSYLIYSMDSVLIQDGSETGAFLAKISGSFADGGPKWEDWDGDSFGTNEEIKALLDDPTNPETPNNPYGNGYPGHIAVDRWGKFVSCGLGSSTGDPVDWGDGSGNPGRIIFDLSNDGNIPSWQDASNSAYIGYDSYNYSGHASWTAWSDYTVFMRSPYPATGYEESLQGNYYNKSALIGDSNYRAVDTIMTVDGPSQHATYHSYTRPSQSPDGTKVALATVLFHSDFDADTDDDDAMSLSYVVAYYPHPPEIISVSSGVVRFDWRTDQATSRGYTQRGWPSEATDDPPPPRETSKFRLWKSANGTTGWTPVGTVDAEIFTKYNFATGAWAGAKYWEITDPSPSGFYAVTAVEHSGLESRVLSNVFNAAGSQTVEYPADPKASTGVTATYQPTAVRYYNVYAHDGSAPTVQQQQRIASIPVDAPKSYLDWLGNTDGSTQYKMTAVDTQGNESEALAVTYEHQATPGQYQLTWTGAYLQRQVARWGGKLIISIQTSGD